MGRQEDTTQSLVSGADTGFRKGGGVRVTVKY